MVRFGVLTVGLFIMVLFLCGAALMTETSAPRDLQILLPDDSCLAPCWYGIQVNTKDEHVHTLLSTLPNARDGAGSKEFSPDGQRFYTSYVIISTRSRIVTQVMLDISGQVTLGELFARLGNPDCVRLATGVETRLIFFYEEDRLEIFTDPILHGARLHPATPVRFMYYHPSTPKTCAMWQGFTWLSLYGR